MDIAEFQRLMEELYIKKDKVRGVDRTMLWLVSEIGELTEAIRLEDSEKIAEELADVLAWLCSVANLTEIDLGAEAFKKYPGRCGHCNYKPCQCNET